MGRRKIFEDGGERNRQLSAQRSREKSLSIRDIGTIPNNQNLELREECRYDLKKFLTSFFPELFTAPFSEAHLTLINNLEETILHGESSCVCLPRGFGKSTIALSACIWAAFFSHQKYILLVASSSSNAKKLVRNIRHQLLFNPHLGAILTPDTPIEDVVPSGSFNEIVYPIRRVGNQTSRCAGQLYQGKNTNITLSSERIILPTIPDSPASGIIIEGTGLTSGIRGRNLSTSAGNLRPSLVVVDDPQSDKSSRSATRVDEQFELINACLQGLSSVDKPLATLVCATVIEKDDLAERLLKAPNWRGLRFGVVNQLPDSEQLEVWSRLNQLRFTSIEEGLNDVEVSARCNEFYLEHRAELERGLIPTWEYFRDPNDVSSLQKIMRLFFSDFNSFSKEYMNNPSLATTSDGNQLTIEGLEKKINNYTKGSVPLDVEYLTLGTDSQTLGIYWVLMGHTQSGCSYILDYGKFPAGSKTITAKYNGETLENSLYFGYQELFSNLLNRKFTRGDGLELSIGRVLMDCSHGPTSSKLNQFIRDFGDRRISPVYGRFRGPNELIFGKKKSGEARGRGWSMPPVSTVKDITTGKRITLPRRVICDVGSWKSILRDGLLARQGADGSISIYNAPPSVHREFFQHLTAEKYAPLSGRYGVVDEWKLLPNRKNHWFDCCVYSLCASSLVSKSSGFILNPGLENQVRKRVRLSDLQKNKGY